MLLENWSTIRVLGACSEICIFVMLFVQYTTLSDQKNDLLKKDLDIRILRRRQSKTKNRGLSPLEFSELVSDICIFLMICISVYMCFSELVSDICIFLMICIAVCIQTTLSDQKTGGRQKPDLPLSP